MSYNRSPESAPLRDTSVRLPQSYGSTPLASIAEGKPAELPKPTQIRRFSSGGPPVSSASATTGLGQDEVINRDRRSGSVDEFNGDSVPPEVKMSNFAKALRTGRQRKKTAARTKGGEFQARRKKRRVYFCCISNDIDVEKLADEFHVSHFGMTGQMYDEVLHLTVAKEGTESNGLINGASTNNGAVYGGDLTRLDSNESAESVTNPMQVMSPSGNGSVGVRTPSELKPSHSSFEVNYKEETLLYEDSSSFHNRSSSRARRENDSEYLSGYGYEEDGYPSSANEGENSPIEHLHREVSIKAMSTGDIAGIISPLEHHLDIIPVSETEHSKEVFVFGFGVAVFWGLAKREVQDLLECIAGFIVKDRLSTEEFEAGEDDMAFVTDYSASNVNIANDVITLPALTTVKERLSLSFAIAQSAVLTIFEARVEKKIEEYKYIPEALAASGKVDLSPKQLGTMIGEVFVMQHDVNLHSEILDLPDYFWKEHQVEPLYRMTMGYMEMEPRISVLNKRLDLMRQLMRVLQQQHENAHSVKLEWIVIWLIVISCLLEMWDIVKDVLGLNISDSMAT